MCVVFTITHILIYTCVQGIRNLCCMIMEE